MDKHRRLKRRTTDYLYNAWLGMVRRCTDPKHPAWADYGGRGICVCEDWALSFDAFARDMGERPSPEHSLDRSDNEGGYSPWNCRWATRAEQARNRRPPRQKANIIRVGGLSLRQLAEKHGINHSTIKLRYTNGKRGEDLIAPDLRDGSFWRGQKRNPDMSLKSTLSGEVVFK